jgi:hypothetical protein
MTYALVSLDELKTYLGIAGTAEDALLASIASNASARAERDTHRAFSVTSNVTRTYSTDGADLIAIRDIPRTDASRVVTKSGSALVEGESYWLIPDPRNPDVSTEMQLRAFTDLGPGYKSDPLWFDKNLDLAWDKYGRSALPNDLTVEGVEGHPELPLDVRAAILELAGWMYWRSKAGGAGTVQLPTGEDVALTELPPGYAEFVMRWSLRRSWVMGL